MLQPYLKLTDTVTKNSPNVHLKNFCHTATLVVRAIIITYWKSAWKNTRETQIKFHVTEIIFTSVMGLSTTHKAEDPVKSVSQVRVFYQEPQSTAQPHSHWPANPTSFHYVHLRFCRSLCYTEEGDRDSSETFVDLSIYELTMRHIPDDGNLNQQCLRTSQHAHIKELIYNLEHASVKFKDRKRSLSRKKRPQRVVALEKQPQHEVLCCGCF